MTERKIAGNADWETKSIRTLYDDALHVTPGTVARARSIGEIVSDVVEKGAKAVGDIANRYTHARARTGYGAETVSEEKPGYSVVDAAEMMGRYVDAKPANQSWLRYVTDKVGEYVFGASVEGGEEEGMYVDENLFGNALKFYRNWKKNAKDKVNEYASHFVKWALTGKHEEGHYREGLRNEKQTEKYAVREVAGLAKREKPLADALKAYYRQGNPSPTVEGVDDSLLRVYASLN